MRRKRLMPVIFICGGTIRQRAQAWMILINARMMKLLVISPRVARSNHNTSRGFHSCSPLVHHLQPARGYVAWSVRRKLIRCQTSASRAAGGAVFGCLTLSCPMSNSVAWSIIYRNILQEKLEINLVIIAVASGRAFMWDMNSCDVSISLKYSIEYTDDKALTLFYMNQDMQLALMFIK